MIWNRFNDFSTSLYDERILKGLREDDVAADIARMPVSEYVDIARTWIAGNVPSGQAS